VSLYHLSHIFVPLCAGVGEDMASGIYNTCCPFPCEISTFYAIHMYPLQKSKVTFGRSHQRRKDKKKKRQKEAKM
jgi:hypothetical protein